MAQHDILKRYIDAGVDFTSVTQARAEALVKDLVRAGEVQADQAREAVTDLLERSRRSSERLLRTVRTEVRAQITSLGLVSQADLDRIERRISKALGTAAKSAPRPEGLGGEGSGRPHGWPEGRGDEGRREEGRREEGRREEGRREEGRR